MSFQQPLLLQVPGWATSPLSYPPRTPDQQLPSLVHGRTEREFSQHFRHVLAPEWLTRTFAIFCNKYRESPLPPACQRLSRNYQDYYYSSFLNGSLVVHPPDELSSPDAGTMPTQGPCCSLVLPPPPGQRRADPGPQGCVPNQVKASVSHYCNSS